MSKGSFFSFSDQIYVDNAVLSLCWRLRKLDVWSLQRSFQGGFETPMYVSVLRVVVTVDWQMTSGVMHFLSRGHILLRGQLHNDGVGMSVSVVWVVLMILLLWPEIILLTFGQQLQLNLTLFLLNISERVFGWLSFFRFFSFGKHLSKSSKNCLPMSDFTFLL